MACSLIIGYIDLGKISLPFSIFAFNYLIIICINLYLGHLYICFYGIAFIKGHFFGWSNDISFTVGQYPKYWFDLLPGFIHWSTGYWYRFFRPFSASGGLEVWSSYLINNFTFCGGQCIKMANEQRALDM